jgi:hypothetical protein
VRLVQEALRGERDPAGLGEREAFGHGRTQPEGTDSPRLVSDFDSVSRRVTQPLAALGSASTLLNLAAGLGLASFLGQP